MADFNPPRLDPVSMAWNTVQTLTASRYDIIARGGHADQARSILQQAGLLVDHPAEGAPAQGVGDTTS